MEFLKLPYWWILFTVASLLMISLGVREACRPWILRNIHGLLYAFLPIMALLIWIACIFTALLKFGFIAATSLFLATLTVGIITVYVFKRRVSDAELMYSQQRESDAITGALRKVEICDILKNHNGGSNELIALRQLLLRLGVEGKKVDKAVKNPEMVRFYLERKSSWSRNDWIELVNWIKTGRRH